MAGVVEQHIFTNEPLSMPPGLLTPAPVEGWSARIRSLEVDGVRADHVQMGPYRLDVPPLTDRADARARLMLVIVLDGTSSGRVDGHPLVLDPGRAAIVDGRAAMRFEASGPVRALRLFVDEDHLPSALLRSPSLPFARLRRTPLVNGCIGLIGGLLQAGGAVLGPHDEVAVARPLIALLSGLLDEALLEEGERAVLLEPERGPVVRRAQIEAHVDDHLADPELGVGAIAAALGVSVRTVHAAFEGTSDTVAAFIRDRRLARAKALLIARDEAPRVDALARRVGFSGPQLTRAFQSATGRTARQWWEDHRTQPPALGPASR